MLSTTNTPMSEALSLLVSWNLQQLCNKFKEQEVCTVAFQYLTDEDVCELIPKIGQRAIFRSHLLAWRQQQELKSQDPMVVLANSEVVTSTVAIKTEFPETSPEEAQASNQCESAMIDYELLEDNDSKTGYVISEPKCDDSLTETTSPSLKQLDVQSVLRNCYEGTNAIEYYNENKCLDKSHRKIVVRAVIGAALDKRMKLSANHFHNINKQLLQIFPNESDDTFYVPRVGNTVARGMLYNKYVNQCRRLRRDGLLKYRRDWTNKKRSQRKYIH